MQSSEIVTQSAIFALDSGHRCLTDQMLAVLKQRLLDQIFIGDVQKTSPSLNRWYPINIALESVVDGIGLIWFGNGDSGYQC
jgi:hypothetical protein